MDTSFMDFSYFVIMFMVALVAGFINVVSGGGGFLSIGALLISGLPPANALATNKIQALGSSLTSGIYFLRRGHINVQEHKYVFLSAFIGSAMGTTLIQFIEPELLKKNLVHLSDWEWGFRQLTNSKKPVITPADMKGMKIRTPPAFAYQAFVEAAGGNAVTIAFAELIMAMKQGVVDGQENPVGTIYDLKLYETQKYMSDRKSVV